MQGTYWTVYNQQTMKGQEGSSQSLGRDGAHPPWCTSDFFLFQTLALWTVKEIISVVLSHPVHSYLLWQPQKVIILNGDLFILEIWNNNHWQFYATFEEHCKFFLFYSPVQWDNASLHIAIFIYQRQSWMINCELQKLGNGFAGKIHLLQSRDITVGKMSCREFSWRHLGPSGVRPPAESLQCTAGFENWLLPWHVPFPWKPSSIHPTPVQCLPLIKKETDGGRHSLILQPWFLQGN